MEEKVRRHDKEEGGGRGEGRKIEEEGRSLRRGWRESKGIKRKSGRWVRGG